MKVLHRKLLIQTGKDLYRAGEGSAVLLKDETVFFVYSQIPEGGDTSFSTIQGGILNPESGEMSGFHEILPNPRGLQQMSVSVERLRDGSIGMAFLQRFKNDEDCVMFSRSFDEGKTWLDPVNISEEVNRKYRFLICNNDRLRQFSNGRIALSLNLYPDFFNHSDFCFTGGPHNGAGMLYSDDYGKTWRLSEPVALKNENIVKPARINVRAPWEFMTSMVDVTQEPGVEELPDGRIMLYCRTWLGCMYAAYSEDGGLHWGDLHAVTDLISPDGPQSIRKIPGTNKLLCLYNDRSKLAYGDIAFRWRTPLSAAISSDCGKSWETICNIENEEHNYCYTSICFLPGNRVLLTDYQSVNISPDQRSNLRDLKMQLIQLDETDL